MTHNLAIKRRRVPLMLLVGACLLWAVTPAAAQTVSVNTSTGLTAEGAPLALHGYDPVAYFTHGEPRLGLAEHSLVHDGATYRFVGQQHLKTFREDPERFLPAFGGFCAYGVSVGAKFDGDPHVWKIVDNQLFLNLNPAIQELWEKDLRGNIEEADAHWPRIRDRDPATLKPGG